MLTYDLQPNSRRSLYEQLYLAIRADIEDGQLAANDKLPSKRSLAQHLGISVITVENAYRQLSAEGYIETKERAGTFVANLPSVPRRTRDASRSVDQNTGCSAAQNTAPNAYRRRSARSSGSSCPSRQASYVPRETIAGSSKRIRGPIAPTDGTAPLLADFSGAHQSGNLFPFHIWAKTVRQTLNEASKGRLLQTSYDNCGAAELRRAISQHLAGFRGLNVSPDQLVIGAGAQDLYGILVQLLGRERAFAIEDPGYPALRAHYESSGADVRAVPVDEEGMNVPELQRSDASVAHCTPAHQFPTGTVMAAARRHALLDWASQGNGTTRRYIIEDDYDSEFRMRGRPIPPLLASDSQESVIYLNTFTRSLGSVFRIAYMVLPAHLLYEFKERFASRSCMVGALEQLELARFIASGNYERHVNRQRTAYRRLQDEMVALLSESPAGPRLNFRGVGAGLHFLMDVDLSNTPSSSAAALEAAALERGIRLVDIEGYRFAPEQRTCSPEQRATYVMNVSGLDGTRTSEIASALVAAITSR